MKKMNTGICLVLIALMLSSCILIAPALSQSSGSGSESGYTNITAEKAHHMINNNPNIVIVDVRNESEYDIGHLCNAILIPLFQLQMWLDSPLRNDTTISVKPTTNDTVIVYCLTGTRSAIASQTLAENGFTNVYNMLGGIQAWMNMSYPISTTYHNVAFNVTDDKTTVDIEPVLKTYCGCGLSPGPTGCSSEPNANITKTIETEVGNYTDINMQEEYNGTTTNYEIQKTTLWSYNDSSDGINRNVTFTSVVVSNGTQDYQFYSLRDDVQYTDNSNLSMTTLLIPLDSQTYNASLTYISYVPQNATQSETMEVVGTNSTITVSQLYRSLGKALDKLANEYGNSQDASLHQYQARYEEIANETRLVSKLVEKNLTEYNRNILKSTAFVFDDFWTCLLCNIALEAAIGIGCAAISACTFEVTDAMCEIIAASGIGELGYQYVCEEYFNCNGQSTPTYWYAGSSYYTYTVQQGYVQYPSNICGSSPDGQTTLMFAGSYGDIAFDYLETNGGQYAHGDIQIYATSYTGIYSQIWLWVWNSGSNQWQYINSLTIYPGSYSWYDFGYTNICFQYFLVGTYDWGSTTAAYLDCVHITS